MVVASGINIRSIIVAPSVDKITIVAREDSVVASLFIRKSFYLAILMCNINLTVVRIDSGRIIDVTSLLIVAIDIGNIEFASHMTKLSTIHII